MIRCAGYFRSVNSKQFAMELTPSFLCRQMGHGGGGGGTGGCWGGGVILFGVANGMSVLWLASEFTRQTIIHSCRQHLMLSYAVGVAQVHKLALCTTSVM